MKRLWYLPQLLLAILLAASASAAPSEESSYVEDPHNPIEVSAERINQILTPELLQGKVAYTGDLPPEVIQQLVHKVLSSLNFKDLHEREGLLDERGCMPTNFKDLAWSFVPENYWGTTLDEVVRAADIAFIGQVTSRETIFVSRSFISRFTVAIQEVWLPAPTDLRVADEIAYGALEYDLTVAGERICVTYDSTPIPSEGETLLFLAASPEAQDAPDPPAKRLTVTNFFRIDGSQVLPTPYPFLEGALPINIDELRSQRQAGESSSQNQ